MYFSRALAVEKCSSKSIASPSYFQAHNPPFCYYYFVFQFEHGFDESNVSVQVNTLSNTHHDTQNYG
jgi:hypothetical protein